MNFMQLQKVINTWFRDGTIDYARPVIQSHVLLAFEVNAPDTESLLIPVEITYEESQRLLRTFSFYKSNYYSRQLLYPQQRNASQKVLPEYRKPRPSLAVTGAELEQYVQAIGALKVGEKLEITYTEPRPRVMLAVKRAAESLGFTIEFLAGLKGLIRIERTG